MALITCADCGRQVSDAAAACPGCGRPIATASVVAEIVSRPDETTVGDVVRGIGTGAVGAAKAAWQIPVILIVLLAALPIIWLIAVVGLSAYLGEGLGLLLSLPASLAIAGGLYFVYRAAKRGL